MLEFESGESGKTISRFDDMKSVRFQIEFHNSANVLIVFDDKYDRFVCVLLDHVHLY